MFCSFEFYDRLFLLEILLISLFSKKVDVKLVAMFFYSSDICLKFYIMMESFRTNITPWF